jgi:hypothetical protein
VSRTPVFQAVPILIFSSDEHISYGSAAKQRANLIFLINHMYRLNGKAAPRAALLYQELTEALRGAAMARKLTRATTTKAYIGTPELRYLIDMDMRGAPSIELAECHHLAWCIGRFTAARPGSICGNRPEDSKVPANDRSYITWRDIEIERTG